MKRWAAGLVVAAAMLAPAAPAWAVDSGAVKACGPDGSVSSCKAYLYKACVAAQKKAGSSNTVAARNCGG